MNKISLLIKKTLCPHKLLYAKKKFGKHPISILDIGCGNRSFEITKKWLNIKKYTGLDKELWHGDHESYIGFEFIKVNLDKANCLAKIKNNTYDFIILNHVIEHLHFGEQLLSQIYNKLAFGGILYVETPSIKTINYPSAKGFLNFYDEPTHVRAYESKVLAAEMLKIGYRLIRYGTRRDLKRIIVFSPVMVLYNFLFSIPFLKTIDVRGLWDLLGVAEYVVATKYQK